MNHTIWIVERQRDEDYGTAVHAVSWHSSLTEAEVMAARLQREFDEARDRATPWHVDVEVIFDMLQEEEHKKYVWVDCDREECGYFEREHTHMTERQLDEHEEAFAKQLQDWWHAERNAWQDFVEDEVMANMADPPNYCRHLIADQDVHYVCRAIGREPALARSHEGSPP